MVIPPKGLPGDVSNEVEEWINQNCEEITWFDVCDVGAILEVKKDDDKFYGFTVGQIYEYMKRLEAKGPSPAWKGPTDLLRETLHWF